MTEERKKPSTRQDSNPLPLDHDVCSTTRLQPLPVRCTLRMIAAFSPDHHFAASRVIQTSFVCLELFCPFVHLFVFVDLFFFGGSKNNECLSRLIIAGKKIGLMRKKTNFFLETSKAVLRLSSLFCSKLHCEAFIFKEKQSCLHLLEGPA